MSAPTTCECHGVEKCPSRPPSELSAQRQPVGGTDDPNESGWTPEGALRFYADGRHFDVVDGRTRILDTGSVASDALKGISPEYDAMKGNGQPVGSEAYEERIAALEADCARLREDAERWRMVPAFLEKYQLDYVGLLADIDAARREKP